MLHVEAQTVGARKHKSWVCDCQSTAYVARPRGDTPSARGQAAYAEAPERKSRYPRKQITARVSLHRRVCRSIDPRNIRCIRQPAQNARRLRKGPLASRLHPSLPEEAREHNANSKHRRTNIRRSRTSRRRDQAQKIGQQHGQRGAKRLPEVGWPSHVSDLNFRCAGLRGVFRRNCVAVSFAAR